MVKGPPASRAYNAEDTPTRAAEGFAQDKGLTEKDLEICEIDDRKYVVALVKEQSRPTYDVLLEALPVLVAGIK